MRSERSIVGPASALTTTFCFNARPRGIHEIHDIRSRRLFQPLDFFAFGLPFNQFAQSVFVLILEFFRIEVAALRFDDVQGEIKLCRATKQTGDIAKVPIFRQTLAAVPSTWPATSPRRTTKIPARTPSFAAAKFLQLPSIRPWLSAYAL